jgi:D-glycero-alpha-D-manno-heptose-7-phosphate kinase
MIIARSPFRLDLCGGATDVPSFYQKHGGFLVSAAIDKYVYVTVSRPMLRNDYTVKYSETDYAANVEHIRHPIIREAVKMLGIDPPLEITSVADLPGGTGLGSSGSFTTALLKALHEYMGQSIGGEELAEMAFDIEVNRLGKPVGKQDQYAAVYGGILEQRYATDGKVYVRALKVSPQTGAKMERNLLLFFTGFVRRVEDIMGHQRKRTLEGDQEMEANLLMCKRQGRAMAEALEGGDMTAVAGLLTSKFVTKKARAPGMSNAVIDEAHREALLSGAAGGTLMGAGGGGFLLFYASDPLELRRCMAELGMPEVHFGFDFAGTKLL